MSETGAATRAYDGVQKSFHWLVATLLVVQFATKLIPPGGMSEAQLNAVHVGVGPTILLLTLLRLGWRLTHPVPPTPADLAPPLALLSQTTHWAFYALLILMPIAGWMSLSYFGGHPTLLGIVPLPALTAPDKAMAQQWGAIHGVLGWVLLALIALHLTGVAFHVGVKGDGVLGRMLAGPP